ncbi:MAG: MarR family winged helix-turn-helix transcriptional regulator [Bacteroidia bacterium]
MAEMTGAERFAKGLTALQDGLRKHQHDVENKFDVSYLELELIQFVLTHGHLKMKDVADNFYIKLSTLTTIIDKAENHKLLKRVPSKEDRRVVYLEVTKKGEEVHNRYVDHLKETAGKIEAAVGGGDFNTIVDGLEKLTESALI